MPSPIVAVKTKVSGPKAIVGRVIELAPSPPVASPVAVASVAGGVLVGTVVGVVGVGVGVPGVAVGVWSELGWESS